MLRRSSKVTPLTQSVTPGKFTIYSRKEKAKETQNTGKTGKKCAMAKHFAIFLEKENLVKMRIPKFIYVSEIIAGGVSINM